MELYEKQKEEALIRLKMLKVDKSVIDGFSKKEPVIFYSERQSSFFDGILYWMSNEESYQETVKTLQEKIGCLVYHAQLCHTDIGDMLTLLYVSNNPDEWEEDKQMLKEKSAFAYVANLSDPDMSVFGDVGIVPKNGGVSRTY